MLSREMKAALLAAVLAVSGYAITDKINSAAKEAAIQTRQTTVEEALRDLKQDIRSLRDEVAKLPRK